jgi:hypothetical protein
MLESGLTEDGAGKALGWPKARVTARVKLLEPPERAQEMVGAGAIALSSVDQLRSIGRVSPELLDAVVDYLADGNEWAAERLSSQPGWVLDAALREGNSKAFAELLSEVDTYELAALRLGKRTEQLVEEATGLKKQLDRYSYGPPAFRFTDEDVDQARAAGVLIEFENSAPVIVDRSLYRELAKAAILRTTEQLREQAAAAAEAKKQARTRTGGQPEDPVAEARRAESQRIRELGEQAHGVNLDVGAALLNGLSLVDPADMDVARFFVLCGCPHRTNYADRVTMPMGREEAGSSVSRHGRARVEVALLRGEVRECEPAPGQDLLRCERRLPGPTGRTNSSASSWCISRPAALSYSCSSSTWTARSVFRDRFSVARRSRSGRIRDGLSGAPLRCSDTTAGCSCRAVSVRPVPAL